MSLSRIPADWPHRDASQIVQAGGLSWHVQRFGSGPVLLLIHGTAASTHSFRDLATGLADDFEIVMADLPGHGFTGPMDAPGLPRVAEGLGALMGAIGAEPALVAGHSAGAAVALRMTLDRQITPRAVIGLAPALKPYGGAADALASQFVRLAFLNPLAPRLVAKRARPDRVADMIAKTGSRLDAQGAGYYARLLQNPDHVAGVLRLMAHWKLRPLLEDLPQLDLPVTLVVGDRDRATPPREVEAAARRIRGHEVIQLSGLGHLAHEENHLAVAQILRRAAQTAGLYGHDGRDTRRRREGGG